MSWSHWLPKGLLFLSAMVSLGLALYAWRSRAAPGRVPFIVMMLAAAAWSWLDFSLLMSPRLLPGGFPSTLSFVSAGILPVAWLALVLEYMGRDAWLTRRRLVTLSIIPAFTVVLVATNPHHHWMWTDLLIDGRTQVTNGFWFWFYTVYAYGLVFIGCAMLVQRCFDAPGLYRHQAFLLLLSGLVPWSASGIEVLFFPHLPVSLASFAFSITGLVLALGILRLRLFDLAPLARSAILEQMRDGVIVLDVHGRIVDANPAAQRLLTVPVAGAIGNLGNQALRHWAELSDILRKEGVSEAEVVMRFEEQARHFEVRATAFRDNKGRHEAWLIDLRDVSEQRRAEIAREQTLRELREALAVVKTLTGLLPICAGCKRIRDDQGYWNQIEAYISTRSDARFTHSMCPECVEKFYGKI